MTAEDATLYGAAIGVGGVLLGAAIGGTFAWWAASRTNKAQQQIADSNRQHQQDLARENARSQRVAALEAMILKLSELAVIYPTLEKDEYCLKYPNVGDANGK